MLESFLQNSRLASIIQRVQAGEAVDFKREAELQALEIARIGELFALDTIQTEKQADDDLEQRFNALNGN